MCYTIFSSRVTCVACDLDKSDVMRRCRLKNRNGSFASDVAATCRLRYHIAAITVYTGQSRCM